MLSYVIDPATRSVIPVEIDNNWRVIAPMLYCRVFEVVLFSRHALHIDEEARFKPYKFLWFFDDVEIINRGLVIGIDRAGASRNATITIDALLKRITWKD